ncbi:MAG: PEP-CTERM sorting domain-containing protein [Aulosira sp. ZfuVER01]|nr:PEP-CTERM sorting domain-containing protein [Aulosira sp. ZfuVER01]MDZ7997530.1 PEP-CTERM sorting domain-containing protein [Aulosira sp. DedVER01a]MDZ8055605.1 PEP-CTERM sorting domain-containing protein [Aulosira sp. ZfuCHP01]
MLALLLSLFGGGQPQKQPQSPKTPVPQTQKQPQPVPEPTTILGSAIALGGFAYLKKKKNMKLTK